MVAKSNKAVSGSVLGQMIAWVDEGGLVPVDKIEAPKGAYVLTSDEFGSVAELIDNVLIAEDDAFKADIGMQNSGLALAKALGTDPTYAKWESFRMAYERGYLSRKKNASEDSANLSWGRLVKRMTKETGLEKPKAPSKSAQGMSDKRAKDKAKLEAMVDSQLEDALAQFKASDNFVEAKKVKDELSRREKESNKGKEDQVKAMRELIIKQIKITGNLDLLEEVSAMLPSLPVTI
jgi:type II secretory ATPase GspE/PulE/Tfp pilus assembly ATPase PilB-like protein